jgi:2-keto-4-pentenoate hydratase
LGHPLAALAWLANELPTFELQLKEGDYITTGTATDVYAASAGDEIRANFGKLGRVELKVE